MIPTFLWFDPSCRYFLDFAQWDWAMFIFGLVVDMCYSSAPQFPFFLSLAGLPEVLSLSLSWYSNVLSLSLRTKGCKFDLKTIMGWAMLECMISYPTTLWIWLLILIIYTCLCMLPVMSSRIFLSLKAAKHLISSFSWFWTY